MILRYFLWCLLAWFGTTGLYYETEYGIFWPGQFNPMAFVFLPFCMAPFLIRLTGARRLAKAWVFIRSKLSSR
ncbi:hypothetical protein D3W54_14805 [Komagataeibacter medellinensis]|uniref:Uncharacterized protein n=1 Tax=Komagataeibacter medellinensis TaxID=1177712 RepID=A0ABQ6VUE6_9PROT|nr:hypothetical protein D3W54_14805 [Komagataeibacter medellinensis]